MTKLRFPNESDAYRRARSALLDEEIELRQRIANLTELRAQLPAGGLVKEDYGFDELDGDGEVRNVRLSELFDDGKHALFLYGFMFAPDSEGQARHVDSMWPLWNVLDTTPEGRGTDWYPSLVR